MEQEIHWAQRARQTWLQLEELDNKYFQTMATIRKRQNVIWKIRYEEGSW